MLRKTVFKITLGSPKKDKIVVEYDWIFQKTLKREAIEFWYQDTKILLQFKTF